MDKSRELEIAEQYGVFAERSILEADKDVEKGLAFEKPRKGERGREDARTRHLLGMMELYSVRYGDLDQRRRIVEWLEDEIFSSEDGGVAELTFTRWTDLKKRVLEGEATDG